MNTSAIIVAAGSSRRMGFDKLAAPLAGTPVLQRTLEAFLAVDAISEIIVVCPQDRWDWLQRGASGGASKPVRRADGGATRQQSVANGLAALATGAAFVAVQDGARPLVRPDDIARCVVAAREFRAASLARRVTETVKHSDGDDFSSRDVSRDHLWIMETPQVFAVSLLREAYAVVTANGQEVTDEVSALQAIGVRVKFIEASRPNPKITHPSDLMLAAALLTIQ
jgi:2-C-methyl-D-erythritol 4-phosphate cytidylyltransferase